jgi:hypothetical protein
VGFGLDREYLGNGRRVVGEVEAVASADLQHPPGQASQQSATVLGRALGVQGRTEAGKPASEARMPLPGGGRRSVQADHDALLTTLADVPRQDYLAP